MGEYPNKISLRLSPFSRQFLNGSRDVHPAISIPKPELKGLQTSQKLQTKWSHPSLSNISDLSPIIVSSHLSTRRKWNELWAGKKYQIPLLLEERALFLPCPPRLSGSHPQWKPPKESTWRCQKRPWPKKKCVFFYKYGDFLKWWVSPTTMGVFLLKMDQLSGCEMGVAPF